MSDYLYFPGCSLKGSAAPYEKSLFAVFQALGKDLQEIPDWNCCGATAYLSVDEDMAVTLAARNLALAERIDGQDIVAPCSGCYLSLVKAKTMLAEYPDLRARVTGALSKGSLAYEGRVGVRHPLEVLLTDVGTDGLKRHVRRPLKNLRIAPYYGCAILRPYSAFPDGKAPHSLEDLCRIAGATPVDYPHKARCCGGMLTSGVPSVGLRLVEILLSEAKASDADMIVTTCPLCQYNLEVYQDRLSKQRDDDVHMPILYFTQLLGMAFGLDDRSLGLDQLFRVPAVAPCPGGKA
jgi:heterodisulfide reductase subunit B